MSIESHWMDEREGSFTKEELMRIYEDLSDLEHCLQLNHAGGKDCSSAIEAIREVQKVIEELIKNTV